MKSAVLLAAALALVGCGSSGSPGASGTATASASSSEGAGGSGGAGGGDGGSGGGSGGVGGSASPLLAALEAHLLGNFDNSAQHAMGYAQLVERQVCVVPGRAEGASVVWLYVEELDDTSGKRDTYSTRVHEIQMVSGNPVARIYKLEGTHPLATDPYKFNEARDGCSKPELLEAITDKDLLYRDGCDLTFVQTGADFDGATAPDTCAVPGGFINTEAVVSADALDRTDSFHDLASMKTQALSTLEFRRIAPAP